MAAKVGVGGFQFSDGAFPLRSASHCVLQALFTTSLNTRYTYTRKAGLGYVCSVIRAVGSMSSSAPRPLITSSGCYMQPSKHHGCSHAQSPASKASGASSSGQVVLWGPADQVRCQQRDQGTVINPIRVDQPATARPSRHQTRVLTGCAPGFGARRVQPVTRCRQGFQQHSRTIPCRRRDRSSCAMSGTRTARSRGPPALARPPNVNGPRPAATGGAPQAPPSCRRPSRAFDRGQWPGDPIG